MSRLLFFLPFAMAALLINVLALNTLAGGKKFPKRHAYSIGNNHLDFTPPKTIAKPAETTGLPAISP
jgi:hypothetical protein